MCHNLQVAYDSPEIFAELDAATAKLYTSVSAPPTSPSPGAAVPTKSKGVVCVNFFLWEMGRSYMGGSTRKKKQWETWRFEFDLVPSSFGKEAVESKARVSESLRKRIMRISGDIVKKFNQVPKPKAHNFDLYFDMRCAAKPFLHEVCVCARVTSGLLFLVSDSISLASNCVCCSASCRWWQFLFLTLYNRLLFFQMFCFMPFILL